MDLSEDFDALDGRWLQLFDEFQDIRSQRTARKATAKDELEAAQKEIDVELSNIQNEQNQGIEIIKGEADAKIRRVEEQTKIQIQQIQNEAKRKTTEIQEESKKNVGVLQSNSKRKAQEVEGKRLAKRRKHEDDGKKIEIEFLTRLRTLDKRCMPSAIPETPPPSATREVPTNPLPVNDHSTNTRHSADSESLENRRPTLTCLPPLRSDEHEPPSQATRGSDTSARAGKKRRFEGFAKDGCVTCKGRIWRCDGARPICDKCRADGRPCVWPQSRSHAQPIHQTGRGDTVVTNVSGESEVVRRTTLRPSNIDSAVRALPDPSPAFAYDARRRPSQRLTEPPESNMATASALARPKSPNYTQAAGESAMNQTLSNRSPQSLLPGASSLPPRPQTEQNARRLSVHTAQRTITFDDVFQNVLNEDSQEKHFIVEFPHGSGKWYILRCDEHEMNFGDHPFTSAGCHIDSDAHGHLPRTQENCVAELGVLVLFCNFKRAERNNEAYRRALQGGYQPKQGNTGRRHRRRSRTATSIGKNPDHNDSRPAGLFKPFEGIVNPVPGEVYQGAQKKSGRAEPQWCLIVCLPLSNWESIGIFGSLHQSGLVKSMPPCYQRESLDEPQPRAHDWAEGFQNRGPRLKERSFPCLMLRNSLKIPPWDEEFVLPPDKWLFTWLDAASLRHISYNHIPTTDPRSLRGIDDGHEVTRRFRERLEAARAAQQSTVVANPDTELGAHDQDNPNSRGRDEVDRDARGASEVDDHSNVVANESRSGNNSSRVAGRYVPINGSQQVNGSDVEELQEHENRNLVEDIIVVSSSEHDEPESSLSPVTSTVSSDPFDSSYSPRSPSSDGRNISLDPLILDDDFDLGDYNSPPRPPSTITESVDGAASNEGTHKATHDSSCIGLVGSPSAVERLKEIQAELIPGYEDGDAKSKNSTGDTTRPDPHLLFPGLAMRRTHEESTAP